MDSIHLNNQIHEASAFRKEKKGVSGSTIKIIAIITMLIDHIAAALLGRLIMAKGYMDAVQAADPMQMQEWITANAGLFTVFFIMRMIGRLGFPIFCFLLVEGFQKTRNLKKYILRLGMFALVSELPFDLAFHSRILEFDYQNVFFTLFLGILTMYAFRYITSHELPKILQKVFWVTEILIPALYVLLVVRNTLGITVNTTGTMISFTVLCLMLVFILGVYVRKRGTRWTGALCADLTVLFAAMFLADLLHTDYGSMGVLTIVLMYLFRENKTKSMLAGCIVLCVMSPSELPAFLDLIPAALYNGKRGLRIKYFFYAFYPGHLLILYLIAVAMGVGKIAPM